MARGSTSWEEVVAAGLEAAIGEWADDGDDRSPGAITIGYNGTLYGWNDPSAYPERVAVPGGSPAAQTGNTGWASSNQAKWLLAGALAIAVLGAAVYAAQ